MTDIQLRDSIEKIIGDNIEVFEDSKKVKVKYIKAVDQLLSLFLDYSKGIREEVLETLRVRSKKLKKDYKSTYGRDGFYEAKGWKKGVAAMRKLQSDLKKEISLTTTENGGKSVA